LHSAAPTTKSAKGNSHEISSPNCWPSEVLSLKSLPLWWSEPGIFRDVVATQRLRALTRGLCFFWPLYLVTTVACEQLSDRVLGRILADLDGRLHVRSEIQPPSTDG